MRRNRRATLAAGVVGAAAVWLIGGAGGAGAHRATPAANTPGFGDMSLSAMIAARKSIPVPSNLPNFKGQTVTVMGDGGHNMNVWFFSSESRSWS